MENKDITVRWDIDKGQKNIFWNDPYQIRQILMNLLNNAIQAVEKEGMITLSIHQAGGSDFTYRPRICPNSS
ncbi:MAG: hypothetical protein ABIJ31_08425 [Pseudomonadota bacterium]